MWIIKPLNEEIKNNAQKIKSIDFGEIFYIAFKEKYIVSFFKKQEIHYGALVIEEHGHISLLIPDLIQNRKIQLGKKYKCTRIEEYRKRDIECIRFLGEFDVFLVKIILEDQDNGNQENILSKQYYIREDRQDLDNSFLHINSQSKENQPVARVKRESNKIMIIFLEKEMFQAAYKLMPGWKRHGPQNMFYKEYRNRPSKENMENAIKTAKNLLKRIMLKNNENITSN